MGWSEDDEMELKMMEARLAQARLDEREKIVAKARKWADDLDLFKDKSIRNTLLAFADVILLGAHNGEGE